MMSAPNPRIPDNAPKLSWFGKGNGKSPEAVHAAKAIESLNDIDRSDYFVSRIEPEPEPVREIDLLEELAVILRRLTWSQMQEYCTGTKSNPQDVHEWSTK
jgi:hypothetical protein